MSGDRPDIVVFPPLAVTVAAVSAVILERVVPLHLMPAGRFALLLPGVAILVLSVLLPVTGALAFRSSGTNVDPRKPALTLVRKGPFRFTRNPMYLGMVLLQLGLALTFAIDWALIGAAVLWAVLHFGVVLREEAYLTAKFGAPYQDYLKETRRWL